MATMLRSKAACAPRTSRARTVACSASLKQVQLAGAAAMAAAAILASPAEAGVVLQQPTLKRAFQSDGSAPAAAAAPAEKKAAAAKPKKQEVGETSSEGLDARSIALPGAILFVGGLAFAAKKVDADFDDFIKYTLIKDNNEDGVGYENTYKDASGGIYGPATGRLGPVGSQKVSKTKSGGKNNKSGGQTTKGKLPFKLPF